MKAIFIVLLAVEACVVAWLAIRWTQIHGFFGGLWHWYRNGSGDPIYLAAEIDFLMLIGIVGILIAQDWYARGGRTSALFLAFNLFYFFFPSLALGVYLLYLRPVDSKIS